jgi:hypothetical protein
MPPHSDSALCAAVRGPDSQRAVGVQRQPSGALQYVVDFFEFAADVPSAAQVFEVAHFGSADCPTDLASVDAGLKTTRNPTKLPPVPPSPPHRRRWRQWGGEGGTGAPRRGRRLVAKPASTGTGPGGDHENAQLQRLRYATGGLTSQILARRNRSFFGVLRLRILGQSRRRPGAYHLTVEFR